MRMEAKLWSARYSASLKGEVSLTLGMAEISHANGFKGDPQLIRGRFREIQLLKPDHTAGPIFHQNDLLPRFFTHVFLLRIPKPYGQGISSPVMENLYLLHTRSPSLIASVG